MGYLTDKSNNASAHHKVKDIYNTHKYQKTFVSETEQTLYYTPSYRGQARNLTNSLKDVPVKNVAEQITFQR